MDSNVSFISEVSREDSIRGLVSAREDICEMLEAAAASEVLAWYQYVVVAPYLVGRPERLAISERFNHNASDELGDHFSKLQARMSELGYVPRAMFDIKALDSLSPCPYSVPESEAALRVLLLQNIELEECAIRTYQSIIDVCSGGVDSTTERLAKDIQSDEWEHLGALQDFLADIDA